MPATKDVLTDLAKTYAASADKIAAFACAGLLSWVFLTISANQTLKDLIPNMQFWWIAVVVKWLVNIGFCTFPGRR